MKFKFFSIFGLLFALFLAGCSGTLPTNSYTPQNYVRVSGQTTMGNLNINILKKAL